MSIHIGIGGWTFEPWRGPFYPAGLAQKRELEYAGKRLTGIEINGTYYGSQKPQTFANWAASVPDNLQFSVKASRFATNRKILAQSGEVGDVERVREEVALRVAEVGAVEPHVGLVEDSIERDETAQTVGG